MHMNLHDLIIGYNYNAVTDILKICLQLFLYLILIPLQHNDKFCAITKLNICRILRTAGSDSRRCLRIYTGNVQIHFLALQRSKCTAHKGHQSLSTGINYACLLQYRKHIRCTLEGILHIGYHFLGEGNHILGFSLHQKLYGSLCPCLDHCQDRTLLRLHNSLVRRICRMLDTVTKIGDLQILQSL